MNNKNNISKLLKNKRLENKIQLSKVAEDLKIRLKYLKMIEDDLENNINTYVVGYIKLYANYLHVSIGDHLEDLKQINQYVPPIVNTGDAGIKVKKSPWQKVVHYIVIIASVLASITAIYFMDAKSSQLIHSNQSAEQ